MASKELQASAQKVEKQNSQLKSWLSQCTGTPVPVLSEWLRKSTENPDQSFGKYLHSLRMSKWLVPIGPNGGTAPMQATERPRRRSSTTSAQDQSRFGSHNGMAAEAQVSGQPLTPISVGDVDQSCYNESQSSYDQDRSMSMPQLQTRSISGDWTNQAQMLDQTYPSRHLSITTQPQLISTNYHMNQQSLTQSTSSSRYGQQASPSLFPQPSASFFDPLFQPVQTSQVQAAYDQSSECDPHSFAAPSSAFTWKPTPNYSASSTPAQVSSSFSQLCPLLGPVNDSLVPKCGQNLPPDGQRFCSLLNMLSSPTTDDPARPRLTCRQSYEALQRVLKGHMTVEQVVCQLIATAVRSNQDGSMIDPEAVMSILEKVEAV